MKDIIKPFIAATVDTFETMMDVNPEILDVNLQKPQIDKLNIYAYIGLSGDAQGLVALTFGSDVAMKLYGRFVGEEVDEIGNDLLDSVGEIVNIVAGSAKANIPGYNLSISLPTVLHGEEFHLSLSKDAPIMYVLMNLPEVGEAKLIVSLKMN